MKYSKNELITKEWKQNVLFQIFNIIDSLHSNSIYHTDLNLESLKVNDAGIVYLSNFEHSKSNEFCLNVTSEP